MNKAAIIVSILALVLSGVSVFSNGGASLGGATSGNTTNFNALTLDNGDLTISNGNIVWPARSGATSTLATVGCIQANATSSATTIKLVPSTTGATSTFSGTVYWAYGTCP